MKSLGCIAVTLLLTITITQAQYFQRDTSTYVPYNHNIGLSASSLSGYGLCYRYAFDKTIQIQIGGIALQSKEGNEESWFFGSIGTELQIGIPIKATAFGVERVYAILGASYMYGDNKESGSNFFDIQYNTQESIFTSGIGLGIQTPTFSGFHFTFHGTYFYRNTVRVKYNFNRWDSSEYTTSPLPQLRDITVGLGVGAYFSF